MNNYLFYLLNVKQDLIMKFNIVDRRSITRIKVINLLFYLNIDKFDISENMLDFRNDFNNILLSETLGFLGRDFKLNYKGKYGLNLRKKRIFNFLSYLFFFRYLYENSKFDFDVGNICSQCLLGSTFLFARDYISFKWPHGICVPYILKHENIKKYLIFMNFEFFVNQNIRVQLFGFIRDLLLFSSIGLNFFLVEK